MNDVLTVVVANVGFFLIGRLEGNKLIKPRVMTMIPGKKDGTEQEKRDQIHLQALPMVPKEFILSHYAGRYTLPLREKTIYDLYARVTSPEVDPD